MFYVNRRVNHFTPNCFLSSLQLILCSGFVLIGFATDAIAQQSRITSVSTEAKADQNIKETLQNNTLIN